MAAVWRSSRCHKKRPSPDTLEYAYDEDIPTPLTLIHPRWWYNGPIQERERWRPHYGHEVVAAPTLPQLPRQPPSHNIVASTNGLMMYRETLSPEAQARLDADVVCLQEQLLEHTRQQEVRTSFNRKPGLRLAI